MDGKIASASFNRDTGEVTVNYSLVRKPEGEFSAFLRCANTETNEEVEMFNYREAPEGECIVQTTECTNYGGPRFVPNVCYLIVQGPSENPTYLSKICVDPVSSACGDQDADSTLKQIDPSMSRNLLLAACTDLTGSVDNCGACDSRCDVTEDCVGGWCQQKE
jgi:hypothetical protein